jgi:hypothetical protein
MTSRDVELAEAAADASQYHRNIARRDAAEARATSIALTRAVVNHRAALSDLATRGHWHVPDAEPPVVNHSPRMSASYEMAADRVTPARARRLVRSKCRHLPSDQLEVAVLLTSEVTTNAIVHSEGPVQLEIHMADEVLRVLVTDGGRGEVRVAEDFHWPESGHGLRMVDAMSTRWGVDAVDGVGKRVWFELPL